MAEQTTKEIQTEEDNEVENNQPQQSASHDKQIPSEIRFNKNIKIYPYQRLSYLDKGPVKAYSAEGLNRTNNNLFALVCDRRLTPRRIASQKYANMRNLSLVKLVTSGKILWPDPAEEKYCFIYELTISKPLIEPTNKYPAMGRKPEDIIDSVVNPMIDLLTDMANKDLVHGEIWPGNIFYGGGGVGDKVTLGECLCLPASSNLPPLYEPVERALAAPEGKGGGSLSDDIYSFGVTLAVIMRSNTPEKGMTAEEIIQSKIEKGSYTTLLKDDRFSGAILELLRGLLYDDPNQRWTLEDIQAWQDGRRLSPKQSSPRIKAGRPILMEKKKYTRPELLSIDFVNYPVEAAKIIENDDLAQWIDRAIEDKTLKTKLEGVLKEINNLDQGTDFNHRLCVAVGSVLFPEMPVLYKSLRFNPRGFGKYMTYKYLDNGSIQEFTEVLRNYFPSFVIRSQKMHDSSALNSKFDAGRNFIKQTKMNMGLERCLYYFNPECQCLSPIVEKYYPITPEDLVEALEGVCASRLPKDIFDRHIVSFLSSKSKNNIDPYMADITASEPHRNYLGRLRVLATLQRRSRMKPFPSIAKWFLKNIDPLLDRFHDDKKKKLVKKEVERLVYKGDLAKIAELFDSKSIFEEDLGGFYLSMRQYKKLDEEKEKLLQKMEDARTFGRESGAQVASLFGLGIAAIVIVISAYVNFLKDGL
ncbi:MAG: serine/threonine-protein kinase [Pseudomonadota bacterium]